MKPKNAPFSFDASSLDSELFRAIAMIRLVRQWAEGYHDGEIMNGDIMYGLSVTLEAAESIIMNVEEALVRGDMQYGKEEVA